MRLSFIRPILAIAFVGAVGTAAAQEYVGVSRIGSPEGCSNALACGAVCASRPDSCIAYCTVDAAHAVECGAWAKAYQASGSVEIAQAFGPPGGELGTSPSPTFQPPSLLPGELTQPAQPPTPGQQLGQPPGFEGGQRPPGDPLFGRPPETGELPTGQPFPGQATPPPFTGEQPQMQRPTGIDLGGGLRGTGPGGCRGPEECQKICEDSANKEKCDGFFERFEFAPRGFEEQRHGFGPGGPGMMGGPEGMMKGPEGMRGGPEGMMGGPDSQESQGRQEEMRKRAEEQMLRQIKEGMRQMTRMVAEMEKRIKNLERRKIKIPEEIAAAMAELKTLVARAQNITDPSEMGEIGPEIGELTQMINEKFGDLERLAHAPRMVAQANRMISQFERQLKRLEGRARARKVDVAESVAAAKALLDEMKAALEAGKAAIAQGDAEAAFEQLEQGVFERGDEVGEKITALEMAVEAPRIISQKNRMIRQIELRIRQRERRKEDMAEAKALLGQVKTKFEECKGLVKVRPVPVEELMACTGEFEDLMDQLREELGEQERPELEFRPFELGLPEGLPIAPSRSVEAGAPAAEAVPAQ